MFTVPTQVIKSIGRALDEDAVIRFWITPNPALDNKTPKELWEGGESRKLIDFIESAKSGDMA